MTSISELSSALSTAVSRMPPPRSHTGGDDPMVAVADKLGLSSNELRTRLQDGRSLEEIATEQGATRSDLLSAIRSSLPTDSAEAAAVAERMAATKVTPPPQPPPSGEPRGANTGIQDSAKLTEISRLLQMDEKEVSTQATSATELIKMMQNRGIDLGQLSAVLNSGDLLDVAA